MSNPSWEEMEAKRLQVSHTHLDWADTNDQMITSFQNVASAMRTCVAIIEDYARISPSSIGAGQAAMAQVQANLNGFEMNIDPALAAAESEEVKDKDGKPKKEKVKRVPKPKDPNAPKRPPSAYLIYQNAMREEMKAAHPEFSYKEILNEISARWNKISPEEKQVSRSTADPSEILMVDLRYNVQGRERQVLGQGQGIQGEGAT